MSQHRGQDAAACALRRTQMTRNRCESTRALLWRLVKAALRPACYFPSVLQPLVIIRERVVVVVAAKQSTSTTVRPSCAVAYKGRCAAASR